MYTDFTWAECRAKAKYYLELAERDGTLREQLRCDAAGWLLLAEHLYFIECTRTGATCASSAHSG